MTRDYQLQLIQKREALFREQNDLFRTVYECKSQLSSALKKLYVEQMCPIDDRRAVARRQVAQAREADYQYHGFHSEQSNIFELQVSIFLLKEELDLLIALGCDPNVGMVLLDEGHDRFAPPGE